MNFYTLKFRYLCHKLCKIHSPSVDLLDNSKAIASCYWFWFWAMFMFLCSLYFEIVICLSQTVQNTFRVRRFTGQFKGNRPMLFVLISGNAYVFVYFYTLKFRYLCHELCKIHSPSVYLLDNSKAIASCYWFWFWAMFMFLCSLYFEIAICLSQTVQNTFRVRRFTG